MNETVKALIDSMARPEEWGVSQFAGQGWTHNKSGSHIASHSSRTAARFYIRGIYHKARFFDSIRIDNAYKKLCGAKAVEALSSSNP